MKINKDDIILLCLVTGFIVSIVGIAVSWVWIMRL